MKNILAILAVFATLAMFGCASSSTTRSPWAAGNAPAPAAAPSAAKEAPAAAPASVESPAVAVEDEGSLLKKYPKINKANREKALTALASAQNIEELPDPETNRATILNVNTTSSLIEFKSMAEYKAGQRVVIGKGDFKTLYEIVLVETGNRYIAEEVRGVLYTQEMKELFTLVPADDVICVEWIDPEDKEAVKKAAAQANLNSDDAESAVDDEDDEEDDEGGFEDEE
ncbi:MAG: hypothetical protein K6B46_01275 [Opitutales bacterium]|nr:hypothetical protein [Opitutales bacterium]